MNYVAILIYKGMELVLDADGVWITPDPTLTVYMNTIFSPTVYPPSPTAGNSEYAAQARAAGTKLGTEPRWAPAHYYRTCVLGTHHAYACATPYAEHPQ